MIKVKDLLEYLKEQDPELPVYIFCGEQEEKLYAMALLTYPLRNVKENRVLLITDYR